MFGHKRHEEAVVATAMALQAAHQSQKQVLSGASGADSQGILLKGGERSVYRINGASLVEPRRGAGQWQGRSSGVSVPVGAGVRVRMGQSRGHFVQGAEAPTVVDRGTALFTSTQLIFAGPKITRTWLWSKALSITIDTAHFLLSIGVSNRQKTSGVSFSGIDPQIVGSWLDVALALHNNTASDLLAQLAAAPTNPVLLGPST